MQHIVWTDNYMRQWGSSHSRPALLFLTVTVEGIELSTRAEQRETRRAGVEAQDECKEGGKAREA